MAFTKRTRQIIKRRANGVSEVSGKSDEILHAAHINHKRKTGYYNHASNGIYLTITEHLRDHLLRVGINGLSRVHNMYAVCGLTQQIVTLYGEEVVHDIYEECQQPLALESWLEKLRQIEGVRVP